MIKKFNFLIVFLLLKYHFIINKAITETIKDNKQQNAQAAVGFEAYASFIFSYFLRSASFTDGRIFFTAFLKKILTIRLKWLLQNVLIRLQ